MTTITQEVQAVRDSAKPKERPEVVRFGDISVGDVIRQGDLYLVKLGESVTGEPLDERQLAPGTTQGSRHVATGDCIIRRENPVMEIANSQGCELLEELVGPSIECRGTVIITHPEHNHIELPAGETFGVYYQRAFAKEVQRVQD